jgi:hypothetical protein
MLRAALLGPAMISSSRTLVPALVLSAVVAANGASLSAQPDPDMTGTAPDDDTRQDGAAPEPGDGSGRETPGPSHPAFALFRQALSAAFAAR